MINELIASVDKVLGQVSPDAPTSQPAPACEIIVGVCREDNPADVDDAYGAGTYARLFPKCEECGDVPSTHVTNDFELCDDCYGEMRSHYGIKPFDEGGNWSGRV